MKDIELLPQWFRKSQKVKIYRFEPDKKIIASMICLLVLMVFTWIRVLSNNDINSATAASLNEKKMVNETAKLTQGNVFKVPSIIDIYVFSKNDDEHRAKQVISMLKNEVFEKKELMKHKKKKMFIESR